MPQSMLRVFGAGLVLCLSLQAQRVVSGLTGMSSGPAELAWREGQEGASPAKLRNNRAGREVTHLSDSTGKSNCAGLFVSVILLTQFGNCFGLVILVGL